MNLDSSEYNTINDTIIIHWSVNKSIGIIEDKFKKLIFSNYDDFNASIHNNNKFILCELHN